MKQCPSYGMGRRSFLQIGALPILGLNLANILKLSQRNNKSCILFYLGGGMSHIDTYDPKPDASSGIRGEYKPISTNVPGIFLSEQFPKQAQVADKFSLIRSYTHDSNDHEFGERRVISGYSEPGQPCFSATLMQVMDGGKNNNPPLGNILLGSRDYNYLHTTNSSSFIKKRYNPLFVEQNPADQGFKVDEIQLANGLTISDLRNRFRLLDQLDGLKRLTDKKLDDMDTYYQQAYEIITGQKVVSAFNIGEESRDTCDLYGRTPIGHRALLARRLIESGVKFVTIHARGYDFAGWDYHKYIFQYMPIACAPYDQAIAALIVDLAELNLLDDVLVLAFGEFGRTPKINEDAGRDHWPKAGSILVAGGGVSGGHIYGSTDFRGAEIKSKPVSPQDFLATIFNIFGFEPETYTTDSVGRRHFIVPEGSQVIRDLFI